ncbi:PREDICTED: calmodulin-binding protein 60 G-like isoform X2 [Lupinus angustifolius]|nr:PREDICTED: calmodulin-binding protein 60 G-like isoform X2 [Lupinus angustifolius]
MMVSNKKFLKEHESSGKIPIQKSKGKPVDAKQSMSDLRNVINVLCMNEHNSFVETFLRRVVREVVEHKIQDYQLPRTRIHNQSGAKLFHLCFINKLPDKIFTLCNIIAEDKSPLQIALFDVSTNSIVNDGPLSSIKIEICALNGDFGSEDWTEEEFNANVLKEREGKGLLVNGDRFITLKNGVGFITKMTFTDNSRWLRNRKFRLGAKVMQSTSTGTNIKEGISEAFVVKDYRGESYKKHYPPALDDDIWRLAKIGKNGKIHMRLALHGIHTVKDLLQLYTINQSLLHEKFGKISKKLKLAIIEHAKTCVIDDYKLYSYQTEEQPIGLIFNSIYNLMEVTFDGQNYHSPNTLSPSEKSLVELVKQIAYKNVNNLKSIDETSLNCVRPATCLRACQSYAQDQVLQHINISTAYDIYQQETWSYNSEPFITSSYIDEGVHDYQTYVDPLPDQRDMSQNSYVEDDFFSGMYIEGDNWNLNGSHFLVS